MNERYDAYRNTRELRMHTDRCGTVGSFCLRRAKSGGESGYSSALAVQDWIRELKPELLKSIWTGCHLSFEESTVIQHINGPFTRLLVLSFT